MFPLIALNAMPIIPSAVIEATTPPMLLATFMGWLTAANVPNWTVSLYTVLYNERGQLCAETVVD